MRGDAPEFLFVRRAEKLHGVRLVEGDADAAVAEGVLPLEETARGEVKLQDDLCAAWTGEVAGCVHVYNLVRAGGYHHVEVAFVLRARPEDP